MLESGNIYNAQPDTALHTLEQLSQSTTDPSMRHLLAKIESHLGSVEGELKSLKQQNDELHDLMERAGGRSPRKPRVLARIERPDVRQTMKQVSEFYERARKAA